MAEPRRAIPGAGAHTDGLVGRRRMDLRVRSGSLHLPGLGTFPTGSLESQPCTIAADLSEVVCPITEASYDAWVVEHFDPEVRVPAQR